MVLSQVSATIDSFYVGDYNIEYSYNNVEKGEDFTLTVSITNLDDSAKEDVILDIDSSNPFDVDDNKWKIGTLAVDEKVTEIFRVEVDDDTKKGTYDLEFTLEDSDDDYDDEFKIEVESDKAEFLIGEVNSIPDLLMPDQDDVKLEITLENIGGGDAEFVKVKLILPEGFSTSSSFSDQTNLGVIEKGDSKVATFYFDISDEVKSGIKNAKLILDYESNGNSESDTLEFELPVKGTPQFAITYTITNPNSLHLGTEDNTIKITIQNIGEETGKETSVRVFENTDMPFEFNEKTDFIGDIKSGQSGTAVFSFNLDNNFGPKQYLLKIQTRTVTNGDVLIKEHTIPVQINEQAKNRVSPLLIGLVILIPIGLILLFNLKKKNSKMK